MNMPCPVKEILLSLLIVINGSSQQNNDPFKVEPPNKPNIKEVSDGIFQVGTVLLNKKRKEVTLPVAVNMNEGPMEYLVVTGKGKTHESLLVTSAEPFHLQVAMLLINCKGSDGKLIPEDERKAIPGDPVEMELRWMIGKIEMKSRLEKFVARADKKPVKEGPFIFNGSRMFNGSFLAQRDGSIVSLITDNSAQFNNPRAGRGDDDMWRPQRKGLPPLDSNGTLVIRVARK